MFSPKYGWEETNKSNWLWRAILFRYLVEGATN